MKKLDIKYKDGSRLTFKMRDSVPHSQYWDTLDKSNVQEATIQKYPLKQHPQIYLMKNGEKAW